MLCVYIPCKDKEEATHISLSLLKKKLIVCSNISPTTSMYLWKGAVETADEYIIVAKTLEEKYAALQKEVEVLHSYDCPCITAWKIDKVNDVYKKYVEESIRD
jgi:periplasmic divalent cation tolerance protein